MMRSGEVVRCNNCNKEFYLAKWRIERIHNCFCSKGCHDKYRKGKIKTSNIIECKICKKPIIQYKYQERRGRGIYCSRKCANIGIGRTLLGHTQSEYTKLKRAASNTGLKRTIEFRLNRSGEKCHLWKGGEWTRKYRGMAREYRSKAEWGYWRKQVFERDNYTCQDCGIYGIKLEPHHIIPLRKILQENLLHLIYDVSNGITLCRKCHEKTFKNNNI